MSPSQYKIADYIEKNTHLVLISTEQEIGNAVGVSIASVSRFWRSMGYNNLKDFKASMGTQMEVSPAGKMKNLINKVDEQSLPYHTLQLSIDHLYRTIEQLSTVEFQKSVDLLFAARKIYIYGQGPASGLVDLLHYRMSRYGMDIQPLKKGGSELFEDIVHFEKEDVVVLFGFIRLLPEAAVILENAKDAGYKTILITDRLISDFPVEADINLFASRGEVQEFHSMIGPTFLVENLILAAGVKNKEANLERLERLNQLRKRYAAVLPRQ